MSNHRRHQNIHVPADMRPTPTRTSVSRTVRDIHPAADSGFTELGAATVFDREVIVATVTGKHWVIVEVQSVQS